MSRWKFVALLPLLATLGGCNFVVLKPAGDVALQQRDLIVVSTALMLLVIVPVMLLTVFFAWRYRQSNAAARYEPDWDHSTQLELVIWAAPLLIIICLGAVTWMATHLLDPYRGIGRIAAGTPVSANAKPLDVEVVALDWKWLFIYPQYGIATVNELAAPVDRPISFRITSATVMNSFYIPALAGQVYAMAGMETKLHAVINKPGTYEGFSANYSGAGFSGMHFAFHSLTAPAFDVWVAGVKSASGALTRDDYLKLERPSENEPVHHYARVDADLYRAILNLCVTPGKMCASEMAAIDAKGGLGLAGVNSTLPLSGDKRAQRSAVLGPAPSFVVGICDIKDLGGDAPPDLAAASRGRPLVGAGLPRPDAQPARSTSLFGRRLPTDS